MIPCLLIFQLTKAQVVTQLLNQQWQFSKASESKWLNATVPGTIHTDLMAHKLIPDPFYRDNEKKIQWVSQLDWQYKTKFDLSKEMAAIENPELVFEGLDTYAKVYLNGELVLKASNMFRTWRLPVGHLIKNKNNTLHIIFESAEKKADSLASDAMPLIRPSENNRHYLRKAQYHFGWDWGPRIVTAGIWRNVSLQSGTAPKTEAPPQQVQLVQQADSIGQSFYFTVNGLPTFMKGANWIPADMFLPRITKDKYRSLLIKAKEANFNMLRVWGGGIYEDDAFYELCDSLGIYVWQDFMFAGAMYPAVAQQMENMRQEAIDNIVRLRKYKCIVVWCGNNEIDEAWNNWGWQKQHKISAADSAFIWREYQQVFHELLPELVAEYGGGRPYITTSPKYGWGRAQSMSHGDSHYWGLWHGMEPISKMKEKVPRFMSEYGMQAMPNMSTIRKYTVPADLDLESEVMKIHQKHGTGYKNIDGYLKMENLSYTNFEEYVAATQELQSRALGTAISAQMFSGGRCMGTLLWQLNDCWPVCSWSILDYYGEPKKAYQTVKDLYAQEAETVKK